MCTLSIIPWNADALERARAGRKGAAGVRVECNRDESRLRPIALPPRKERAVNHLGLMPIDPVSEGTWIGAGDTGLVNVLMNVYQHAPVAPIPIAGNGSSTKPTISRGRIIPRVLRSDHLQQSVFLVREMDLTPFQPFRLVVLDRTHLISIEWAGGELLVHDPVSLEAPVFFSSSGLGDEVVRQPRQKLFEQMLTGSDNLASAQDAFHRHFWPDKTFASVWMTRPEAMTVSRTIVELGTDEITMKYFARQGDTNAETSATPVSLTLAGHNLGGRVARRN